MRCFGLIILNYKMFIGKSAKGLSIKTLELYGIVFFTRLFAIVRHQGYLPYDKSGDYFYHLVEMLSLLSTILSIYLIIDPLKSTYTEKFDRFGNLHIPSPFGSAYIVIPSIVLAILIHP